MAQCGPIRSGMSGDSSSVASSVRRSYGWRNARTIRDEQTVKWKVSADEPRAADRSGQGRSQALPREAKETGAPALARLTH